MDFDQLLFGLILGLLMIFSINWIYFFDWTNLIGWLVNIIAPEKEVKGLKENFELRENTVYKLHIKKWKKRFLLSPALFTIVFIITTFIFKNLLISYFASLITVCYVVYGFLANKEIKEKKEIIGLIKKEKRNK